MIAEVPDRLTEKKKLLLKAAGEAQNSRKDGARHLPGLLMPVSHGTQIPPGPKNLRRMQSRFPGVPFQRFYCIPANPGDGNGRLSLSILLC
jgi:hypothetical protein